MNKYLLFFCITSILIISSVNLNAQWKQVNIGSVGGKINSIAVIGSSIFAGTESEIIRSTDNGADWTNVNSNLTLCFASIGSDLFAGTSSGVILSTDNGNTWTAPNTNMNYFITALAVNNTAIFAGTYQNGIFRSTDNGVSWTAVDSGLGAFQNLVTSLAVSSNGTNGATIYAGTASGLCFSTDNGNSWSTLVSYYLGPQQFINCITVNGSIIFVGTPGGIIRSTGGNSFEKADTGLANGTSIFSILVNNSDTFIGTTAGVYLSADSGGSWSAVNNGLPVSPSQVYSIAAASDGAGGANLYAGTNNGVYLSTNKGLSWTAENSGAVGSQVNCFAGNGSKVFAVTTGPPDYNSTWLLYSSDYGNTWKVAADSGLAKGIVNLTLIGSNLYAATNIGIFLSSNDGENWSSINGGVMDTVSVWNIVQSGLNLVVSTQNDGIFFSSNNGVNWNNANVPIPLNAYNVAAFASEVFAGSHEGIYYSSNSGVNWTKMNDTLNDIVSFASLGSTLFAGRMAIVNFTIFDTLTPHPGSLFRSSDNGKTWAQITSILPDSLSLPFLFVHDSDIFMWDGNSMKTVYFSSNKGESWSNLSNNLAETPITWLFVNDSSIFAGIYYGIWQRRLSEITGIKEPSFPSIPGAFKLLQNYPNPFNPSTTIKYQIPMTNFVTLKVYDVLGRDVKTLINELQTAGTHSVIFYAGNLPSGVYFYRINAGSFIQTKKLMVVK